MSCIYPASTTREMNSCPTVSVISRAHSQNGQCRMRMNNLTRNTFGAARLSLVHYAAFKIKCLPFFSLHALFHLELLRWSTSQQVGQRPLS